MPLKLMPKEIRITSEHYTLRNERNVAVLQLASADGTNKLNLAGISALHRAVEGLRAEAESRPPEKPYHHRKRKVLLRRGRLE